MNKKEEVLDKIVNAVKERTGKERLNAYQTNIIGEVVERLPALELDTVLDEFADRLEYYIQRGVYAGIRLSIAESLLRIVKGERKGQI